MPSRSFLTTSCTTRATVTGSPSASKSSAGCPDRNDEAIRRTVPGRYGVLNRLHEFLVSILHEPSRKHLVSVACSGQPRGRRWEPCGNVFGGEMSYTGYWI